MFCVTVQLTWQYTFAFVIYENRLTWHLTNDKDGKHFLKQIHCPRHALLLVLMFDDTGRGSLWLLLELAG